MNVVNVTKYSGELEVFDLNKLIGSLRRSQATTKKNFEDSEELCKAH